MEKNDKILSKGTKRKICTNGGITMFMDRKIEYHKMLVLPKLDPIG